MSEQAKEPAANVGPFGILAEYDSDTALIAAAEKVRDEGYERWDCYSPFPVHGIDPAMGIKRTRLPFVVLCAALCGTTTALLMQWWTNAVDYKYVISGKPFFPIPANIPITFELTVLFSAITAFLSMLLMNGLPRPSSPLDYVKRFARATDDRFFVVIESSDAKYDPKHTKALLESTQPLAIEEVPADTRDDRMPAALVYSVLGVLALGLVPFGLIAAAREARPAKPQFHIVPNMDFQTYYKPQRQNEFFADGRSERAPVDGTVAVGDLRENDHLHRGKVSGTWALTLPNEVAADEKTMARGEERWGIYCAPCHGQDGSGDGMVHRRAFALKEGTWVKPSDVADSKVVEQPIGQLFNSVTHGIRNMPPYGHQISPEDRWAILLYMRALQKSRVQVAAQDKAP